MLQISGIKLKPDQDEKELKKLLCKKLRIKEEELLEYHILHKSLDSRKEPFYFYSLIFRVKNEKKYLSIKEISPYEKPDLSPLITKKEEKIVIIGYGPSGMFAAKRLIEAGQHPIILERGKRMDSRQKDVELFLKTGQLNEESNIQFGEGGAGTFSDAKLMTRIKDPFVGYVLDTFIQNGAKKEIAYEAHSHIGSDQIRKIISSLTDELTIKGAEFHFEEKAIGFHFDQNHRISCVVTDKGEYPCSYCLLGIGHSAFDTFEKLLLSGVEIIPKDVAIGFRIEHPQSLIDKRQYHDSKISLPAAEYFLRYKALRGVYSFCMCPGGIVVPACSQKQTIVTNGMSYAKRDSGIANSAILVQIPKERFPQGPLGGFFFLKEYERKAFAISESYKAPAMNAKDYMENTLSPMIRQTSYPLGTIEYDLNNFFEKEDNILFKEALKDFDRKIPGFISQGIMIAPETRSSSPVRISRNTSFQSVNTANLYPMGEGAGYGGGIMSCALDGIKVADMVLKDISL